MESQEDAGTLSLVDSLDEQDILESLLDGVKPPYQAGSEQRHYLISTPFRYPPLKHGSRYGHQLMHSFFYASESLHTALSESAYYRFLFIDDMQIAYDSAIISQHLSFSVNAHSGSAMQLTNIDNGDLLAQLQDKSSHSLCQAIGEYLVNTEEVDLIRFPSARCNEAINVAIISHSVITSKKPQEQIKWTFQTEFDKLVIRSSERVMHSFYKSDFLVNGQLPRPA